MNNSYFEDLRRETDHALAVAKEARSKGLDPKEIVEIPLAEDVYGRVEGLVGPEGIAEKMRQFGAKGREEACTKVADEIMSYDWPLEKKLEQAVRTGLALFTEGVVSAPIEGISHVRIKKNPDNSQYVAVYFAGPIRGAGGTGQAFALLMADYCRKLAGLADYRPTGDEVERYVEEVNLYAVRTRAGQYVPTEEEVRHVALSCPVCIHGEPTEEYEINVHKNIPSIETNRVRSGVCLVLSEGVCLKAAKIMKISKKLSLDWKWVEKLVKVSKKAETASIQPIEKYMDEIVAGRPIFSYPLRPGGFRLRYGRTRFTGIQSKAMHPATMILLEEYPAFGTQVKTERPGKGSIATPCETIEGPTVLLDDGEVRLISTAEEAAQVRPRVQKILYLGDFLISFGDFLKTNHVLVPAAYCEEYYQKILASKGVSKTLEEIRGIGFGESYEIAKKNNVPLAPRHSFFWSALSVEELKELKAGVQENGKMVKEWFDVKEVSLDSTESKELLEKLGVPHKLSGENIVFDKETGLALWQSLGLLNAAVDRNEAPSTTIEYVNAWSDVPVKDRAGVYIGTSMGRPEKSRERKMQPPVHVLYPVGLWGGKTRDLMKAAKAGQVEVDLETRVCPDCGNKTWRIKCKNCGVRTATAHQCVKCGKLTKNEECCGGVPTRAYEKKRFKLEASIDEATAKAKYRPEQLKGVIGLISAKKTPEELTKGVLRAKHGVSVFRDGTCRYDATEVPCTHFTPDEIGISVQTARNLGYTKDHAGKELVDGKQIVDLCPQDIILSENSADYILRIASFIDDELVYVYGMPPYYNATKKEELVGQQVICIAPHTSAGIIGRIIGFCPVQGILAHPYLHCATRRNCFHPKTEIVIWDENKKEYIKESIGAITEKMLSLHPEKVKKGNMFTTRVNAPQGLHAFSIDTNTHKVIRRPIKEFIKVSPQREWIRVVTTTNREQIVTPDHNIAYLEEGAVKTCLAKDAREGMALPIGLGVEMPTTSRKELNLVEELLKLEDQKKATISIRNKNFFKQLFYANKEAIKRIIALKPSEEKMPGKWYSSVQLDEFEQLVKNGVCRIEDLPEDTLLGIKGGKQTTLKLKVPVNAKLMKLLGYYAAEGHTRKNKTCHQVSFRICDNKLFEETRRCIREVFGIEANTAEKSTKITICSKLVYLLFTEIWKIGSNAHKKRVPSMVMSADKELTTAFVSAYLDGDGYVLDKPSRIRFYSVSRKLLEDVALLLNREGVFARFGKTKPRLPGKTVLDRYAELNKKPPLLSQYYLSFYGIDLHTLAKILKPTEEKKLARKTAIQNMPGPKNQRSIVFEGKNYPAMPCSGYLPDKISRIEKFTEEGNAYCLDIETPKDELTEKTVMLNDQLFSIRCDGDELGFMMLLDGLVNFSKDFLPQTRGGQMDAPLVLTTNLNPSEVDDEVHAMECVYEYPLSLYQASEQHASPGEVDIEIIANRLGNGNRAFDGFGFTHHASMSGPYRSTYVKFKNMDEKVEDELLLMRKIRAVDVADAAERIILNHFFPDLYGNLRSFSKQIFRCANCNTKYRRVPLIGKCRKCGNKLLLTISKGGIEKYLELSKHMAEEFNLPNYLKQRLMLIEKEISSIFEDDKSKQFNLSEYL
ncbi:DNA polymerase II large subunit [Candidatus Micrarchaeota archaeon]|nr:DNA polymerase II large subunit [Candidatus Micrarchaeota archaeon]